LLQLNSAPFLPDLVGSDVIGVDAQLLYAKRRLLTVEEEENNRCRPGK